MDLNDRLSEKLWEVDIKADETILSAITEFPDKFFLDEIIESFNLLNRRGKYEAYSKIRELTNMSDDRFKK
jgi:hypothetical protein